MKTMEKNDFYELLDGIIECSEKVAKLGRLLRNFVPQFMELIPERPIEGKAVEVKQTKALEDKKATKKAEPNAEPKNETPTYTFEEIRKAFAAKSHAGFTVEVKALIGKYGANRLSDIKEADYAAIMRELEVIG
jgi:hypothetical protein